MKWATTAPARRRTSSLRVGSQVGSVRQAVADAPVTCRCSSTVRARAAADRRKPAAAASATMLRTWQHLMVCRSHVRRVVCCKPAGDKRLVRRRKFARHLHLTGRRRRATRLRLDAPHPATEQLAPVTARGGGRRPPILAIWIQIRSCRGLGRRRRGRRRRPGRRFRTASVGRRLWMRRRRGCARTGQTAALAGVDGADGLGS